ncbi:MAG: VCBS repeat-containing protein [Planctomycetes bacterium]|nr:VCBS repeat-containing protein [Planctomycetota bacterium]
MASLFRIGSLPLLAILTPTLLAQDVGILAGPRVEFELAESLATDHVLADIDGDGDLDMLFAMNGGSNSGGDLISVLTNDGSGDFADSSITVGLRPRALCAADFDGDSDIDFAVTLYQPYSTPEFNAVRVWLNNGSGSFTAGASLSPVGSFGIAIEAADVDEDGHPDLLVAHNHGASVLLYRGLGNGQFAAGTSLANTAGSMSDMRIVDVDGDGHLDLVSNFLSSSTVRFGDGHGAFLVRAGFALPLGVQHADFADLNRDGRQDLLGVISSGIGVWLQVDGLQLVSTQSIAAGVARTALSVGDCNGDGIPDFTTVAAGVDTAYCAAGNGDGTFRPFVALHTGGFPTGTQPQSARLGDLDGDGTADLAVLCRNLGDTAYVQVWRQQHQTNAWNFRGHGCRGSGPGGASYPWLQGLGTLQPNTPATLQLRHARAGSLTALVLGLAEQNRPFAGGTMVPTEDALLFWLGVDTTGEAAFTVNWPAGLPSGLEIYAQMWTLDAAASGSLAGSNGVRLVNP